MLVYNRRTGEYLVELVGSELGGVPSCPLRSAGLAGGLYHLSREPNEPY